MNFLFIDLTLTQTLSYAPLLCHVEVEDITGAVSEFMAPKAVQALSSLPQSITWQPLSLRLHQPQSQNTVLEFYAALSSTPLAQAVSKLTFFYWQVEPPIAALRATFPNILHLELIYCNQIAASSLSVAVAAWPMLQSISIYHYFSALLAVQQHLEAAARTAAELKEGQPFEVVLRVLYVYEGDAASMDVQVAAIHNAGGGKVDVRWMHA